MREIIDFATDEKNSVIFTGDRGYKRFTMKADGRLFRNLMNGLYSNKVSAVIREIVSNALDVHATSKTLASIICTLPTSIVPFFVVRDFGAKHMLTINQLVATMK